MRLMLPPWHLHDGAPDGSRQPYFALFDCRIVKPPTRMTWIGSVPDNNFRASMSSRTLCISRLDIPKLSGGAV